MKPRVFLSHTKKDKDFIVKLANELRPARVDVWYDDWEIPPGASLRTKIFEEGIQNCDIFFVYLTPNSVESAWVKQELDAAFVTEFEERGGFLCLFVDSDETRNALPLDLRSRRIPILNDDTLADRLLELTALAWETFSRSQERRVRSESRIEILELQNRNLELELENVQLQTGTTSITDDVIRILDAEDLVQALVGCAARLAERGQVLRPNLIDILTKVLPGKEESVAKDCLDRFFILDLIGHESHPTKGFRYMRLTDFGREVVRDIHIRGLDG